MMGGSWNPPARKRDVAERVLTVALDLPESMSDVSAKRLAQYLRDTAADYIRIAGIPWSGADRRKADRRSPAGSHHVAIRPAWDEPLQADVTIPAPVLLAIIASQYDTGSVIEALRWHGVLGCFCFMAGSVFVGVETDGHIHT